MVEVLQHEFNWKIQFILIAKTTIRGICGMLKLKFAPDQDLIVTLMQNFNFRVSLLSIFKIDIVDI